MTNEAENIGVGMPTPHNPKVELSQEVENAGAVATHEEDVDSEMHSNLKGTGAAVVGHTTPQSVAAGETSSQFEEPKSRPSVRTDTRGFAASVHKELQAKKTGAVASSENKGTINKVLSFLGFK